MTMGGPAKPPIPGERDPSSTIEPTDVAAYIASHCQALTDMARWAQLDFLAYLVDMARLEAVERARRRPARTLERETGL